MLIAIRLAAPTIRDNGILRSSRSDDHIAEHFPRTGCYLRRWPLRRRCPPCPCWRSRTRRKSGTADMASAAMAAAFSKTAAVAIRSPRVIGVDLATTITITITIASSPASRTMTRAVTTRDHSSTRTTGFSKRSRLPWLGPILLPPRGRNHGLGPERRRRRARRAHGGPPPEGELPIIGTGGGHAPPLFTDQPGRQSAMRAAQVSVPGSHPYRSDARTVTRGNNSVVGAALFGDLQLRRA